MEAEVVDETCAACGARLARPPVLPEHLPFRILGRQIRGRTIPPGAAPACERCAERVERRGAWRAIAKFFLALLTLLGLFVLLALLRWWFDRH